MTLCKPLPNSLDLRLRMQGITKAKEREERPAATDPIVCLAVL